MPIFVEKDYKMRESDSKTIDDIILQTRIT